MHNYTKTYSFVNWWCSYSFKAVHTNYIHAYIHTYTLIRIHLRNQCMENIHAFRIVKAFMRYVARRIRRNLLVVANKRANLNLEGPLKYLLGIYSSLISAYSGQTRMKRTSVSASSIQKGQNNQQV